MFSVLFISNNVCRAFSRKNLSNNYWKDQTLDPKPKETQIQNLILYILKKTEINKKKLFETRKFVGFKKFKKK